MNHPSPTLLAEPHAESESRECTFIAKPAWEEHNNSFDVAEARCVLVEVNAGSLSRS